MRITFVESSIRYFYREKLICHLVFILLALLLAISNLKAQALSTAVSWGKILEQEADWYESPEALWIAGNVLVYQHRNGGWPQFFPLRNDD